MSNLLIFVSLCSISLFTSQCSCLVLHRQNHRTLRIPTYRTTASPTVSPIAKSYLPSSRHSNVLSSSLRSDDSPSINAPITQDDVSIWESLALQLYGIEDANVLSHQRYSDYAQTVSLLRVGLPSLCFAIFAKLIYSPVAAALATSIDDSGVFAVVAQDASQYIQNILTTSGLVFSILVGQTYYFMYQQQEATYLALYLEVTMAKSLLEQTALVAQGRPELYQRLLRLVDLYVRNDLQRFNDAEPAVLMATRPSADPLENILFLTSVGEPSGVYSTIRSLRQARASRLGALQKKLPALHMVLLWVLAGIVLFTFPLLGAGVQTIGGAEILQVQSWYLGFIVMGMSLTLGVIYELQRPGEVGAYNARGCLAIMVEGLEEELEQRLAGRVFALDEGPSIDSDGGLYLEGALVNDFLR